MVESELSATRKPTEAQVRAIDLTGGSALVLGVAGSGRTEALALRLARLTGERTAALGLTSSSAAAADLRTRAEAAIEGPFSELVVDSFPTAALRMLHDHAESAGLDPFREPLEPAGRLAMLLERTDELPLRRHEIRGNPAGLLARLIDRIDSLKCAGVTAERFGAWADRARGIASNEAERDAAARELEFAELYALHDQMLAEAGAIDGAGAVLELTRVLEGRPAVREAISRHYPHLIVDELEDACAAELALLGALFAGAESVVAACDPEQARPRSGAGLEWARETLREPQEIVLQPCHRYGTALVDAAHAVIAPIESRPALDRRTEAAETVVRFARCANERSEGQAVAREVAALLAAGNANAAEICVAIPAGAGSGRAIAASLEERGIPYRVAGPGAFFERPEVRDTIAWLRLLADPTDAPAAVRVLSREPVGLRAVDLARCTTIARRRKLDMVSALEAGLESPQISPEGRERISSFLSLYGAAARAMGEMRPDVFVRRLIERVGLRRQRLFAAHPEAAERLRNLSRLGELAARWVRRVPSGSNADFVRYLVSVSDAGAPADERTATPARDAVSVVPMDCMKGLEFDHLFLTGLTAERLPGPEPSPGLAVPPDLAPGRPGRTHADEQRRLLYTAMTRARRSLSISWPEATDLGPARPSPFYEAARTVLGADELVHAEELFGPAEGLHASFRMIRDEVLDQAWRTGGTLNEPRLDIPLDVNRAVGHFLELVKLAALLQRPERERDAESLDAESLEAVNQLLRQAVPPEQWKVMEESGLDSYLLDEETGRQRRQELIATRDEPSLEAFIPRRGAGLALSATDIDLYRTCPLKYKFARVFGIPQEPTINQRFGIVMHRVLERFHAEDARDSSLERLMGLFEAAWRRSGFGSTDDELQFRERATEALVHYQRRQAASAGQPRWVERKFDFQVGPHHLRGRVDRVDELPGGSYELIDYKTGDPKSERELEADLQLAIYRIAAREAWGLEADTGSYWYVLADEKVAVRSAGGEGDRVEQIVEEVGEGIQGQDFEPRPSPVICGWCDFRLLCPASEARPKS